MAKQAGETQKITKGFVTRVLKSLQRGPLKARQIAEKVGSDSKTVKLVLDELRDRKEVKVKGQRAGMTYYVPGIDQPVPRKKGGRPPKTAAAPTGTGKKRGRPPKAKNGVGETSVTPPPSAVDFSTGDA